MDYLDPVKKKAHKRRLYVGYGLMAILIAMSTVILVYLGSGYYVDRQTGNLIQNGQIFVASRPEGAAIYLNDKLQKTKTVGKMVVPSGVYKVSVKKDGYRDWNRDVALDGGSIQRLDYALLIPNELKSSIAQTFADVPYQVQQSQDARFLSMLFTSKPNTVFIYDTIRPEIAPIEIVLPSNLFLSATEPHALSVAEWSADAKYLLLTAKNVTGTVTDYVLVQRESQETPVNLTQRLGVTTQTISFVNGNAKEYFVYDSTQKLLQTAKFDATALVTRLTAVEMFKAYDMNTIAYVTATIEPTKMQARLTDGASTYVIRDMPKDAGYLLDVAKLGSTTVVAAGTVKENKVAIFRNPVGYLKANNDKTLPLATTILHIDTPLNVSFSTDNSVVMVYGANKIATHYFVEDKTTRFDAPHVISTNTRVSWLDGKHITLVQDGAVTIVDFDGSNIQKLVTTNQAFGVFLDTNGKNLFSFSGTDKPFNIFRTSLVLPE